MAGGHHHAGDAAELADGEGQHRGRQRPRQQQRLQPGPGHHLGGVAGEDVGVVPGVVADHHGAAGWRAVVREVRRQPGRGAEHHDPVHPVRPRAERTAQPGGAELERAVEPVGQVGVASPPAATAATIRSSSCRVCGSGSSAAQARARSSSVGGVDGGHARHRSAPGAGAGWPEPDLRGGRPARR